MSFINIDVHSEFFTPQEYPVEILETCKTNDVIMCCLPPPAKQFLAFMLIKEFYYRTDGLSVFIQNSVTPENDPSESTKDEGREYRSSSRKKKSGRERKRSSNTGVSESDKVADKAGNRIPICHLPFESLTNIPTTRLRTPEDTINNEIKQSSVLVCSASKFLSLCQGMGNDEFLRRIRLVVIDNVHEALRDNELRKHLQEILKIVRDCNNERKTNAKKDHAVRTVFLTVSLLHFYGNECDGFWKMEETFKRLETLCDAKVDTTSDVVALLRYSTNPKERIIQFVPAYLDDVAERLSAQIRDILKPVKNFLEEHTFDALASYGFDNGVSGSNLDEKEESDSMIEELRKVPHPKSEPLHVLTQFWEVLDLFGPWCAYRSLIILMHQVEKLKVRTPYERHYLLLGALNTRFTVIQKMLVTEFNKYKPIEVLDRFSTPKLRSVLDILRRFDLTLPLEPMPRPKKLEEKFDEDEEGDVDGDGIEDSSMVNNSGDEKPSAKSEKSRKKVKFDKGKRGRRKHTSSKKSNDIAQQNGPEKVDIDSENKKETEPTLTNGEVHENKSGEVQESEKGEVQENKKGEDKEIKDGETQGKNKVNNVLPIENGDLNGDIDTAAAPEKPSNTNEIETNESTTNVESKKSHGRRRPAGAHRGRYTRKAKVFNRIDETSLCGIIFVENRFDARILFHFLKEASFADPKLTGLNPTIAIDANPEYEKDSREAEMEHKRREECLKKFRYREANILIGTSLLEEGIELPKANLVIRFDPAKSFRSYLFSKGRAQGFDAEYYAFTPKDCLSHSLRQLSTYKVVEQCLLSRSIIPKPQVNCSILPPSSSDWDSFFPRFRSAKLSNSIAIVNRYCARLPSDTFTRLVPLWHMETSVNEKETSYSCHIRLPINSPVKWIIKGVPMPSKSLAKQAVALQTVAILHANGEIDDMLMPIGKESVRQEPDLYEGDDSVDDDCGEFRPGSTKRRQYYNKQLAPELSVCLPKQSCPVYLYWIRMVLSCPLPDEQNTRGRKLHPPENASQCFGIILSKPISPLPPFPIYTRCGEVQVQLINVAVNDQPYLELTADNIEKISAFHHYTFTSVLRLDKYLTLFDPHLSENSYYVVPLKKINLSQDIDIPENNDNDNKVLSTDTVCIDWSFVDLIWEEKDVTRPKQKTDEERKDYKFKPDDYLDAVVMPWYRNHDVPQYFYVAEICENLTPRSQFPGCEFKTFEEYYNKKYNIAIQDALQPLLDVDHTSARLNFLTPRYVNRKGMALPTSSESTKKAKRENLEQKQILVPELCAIHPFTASLWRQAVCLPCILYRMNCILLANNIRITVASQVNGLGKPQLSPDFKWDPLSFGWTLSDVVASSMNANGSLPAVEDVPDGDCKTKDQKCSKKEKSDSHETCNGESDGKSESTDSKLDEESDNKSEKDGDEPELTGFAKAAKEAPSANVSLAESLLMNEKLFGKSANEILSEEMKKCKPLSLEIGTWSNEMASETLANELDYDEDEDELMDPTVALPSNLMMLDKNWTWGGRSRLFNHRVHRALYGSPTHWGEVWDQDAFVPIEDLDDANGNGMDDNMSVTSDMSGSDESFLDEENNFKIQFHNGNTAEALDKRKLGTAFDRRVKDEWSASEDMWWPMDEIDDEVPENINGKNTDLDLDSVSAHLKDDLLRKNFEDKVEENMTKIEEVIEWNAVKTLEPRRKKKADEADTSTVTPSPDYEILFKEFTSTKAPPIYPESEEFRKRRTRSVSSNRNKSFSFDFQPCLNDHVGPSPCQILQALTMSNANDGLNLERLETIGDSFLKYAITSYLFCTFENIHEGKLSHLRSKQVSNVHLYRLGRRRGLGGVMVATKFEPHDNWLPPGYHIPKEMDKAFQSKGSNKTPFMDPSKYWKAVTQPVNETPKCTDVIPYNLVTQQSIPDKSIADCVEALIGAYLTSMGPQGALLFMSWLGIRVLPSQISTKEEIDKIIETVRNNGIGLPKGQPVFYMHLPNSENMILFKNLRPPDSPLLRFNDKCEIQLETLLKGYDQFEESIGYEFRDKSYLLQAFTHASYTPNHLTDCYQRLEFLGDAILDYLITRHLYEDPLQHSPGSLTDLRSALVNNTIFASLAVKNGFHKFFRHCSPGLAGVLQKFVAFQEQHGHTLTQDYYLMDEEECEEAEDIEVPKALGDVFESVAGAIFLDSGMSLDAVWDVYYRIMKQEIEEFSKNVPKSPIRELLELEPETAKFGKPEKLWDGRRVRVSVDIFGVGTFRGIGRNYRIAKCTAAKCALRHVRKIRQTQGPRR